MGEGSSWRTAQVPALLPIPGLLHGFERRSRTARRVESRAASRRRATVALAAEGELLLLKQVHGARVERGPWRGRPAADAAVVDRPGYLLGIETADCLPLLVVDPRRRAVAAAHAGWRGSAAGVAGAAVAALLAAGSRASELIAAIGPGIGACCYEVGEELRRHFPEPSFSRRPGGRLHLDLRADNQRQLVAAGLSSQRIHHLADCTVCRAEHYHSFRRDGAGAGRMVSYVGWRRD